jgi:signal transduction histidine kinase
MRERAILAGGTLTVEERNGRFIVSASIPAIATVPLMVVPGA